MQIRENTWDNFGIRETLSTPASLLTYHSIKNPLLVCRATLLEYGGLNFTTTEIGILIGIPAIFTTLFSLYGAPFFISFFGAKKSYILGMVLNMAFIPSLSFVLKPHLPI
jgi:hypothetical protein